jgi:iron complex transport system substrate-binding protein
MACFPGPSPLKRPPSPSRVILSPRRKLLTALTSLLSLAVLGGFAPLGSAEDSVRPLPGPSKIPTRIVSLAPSLTETLDALGVSEALVAVTRFCSLQKPPPNLRQLERIDSPNLETLLSLKPDLVVATPLTRRDALEQMRALGLPLLVLEQQSLESIPAEIHQLARAVQKPEAAQALITQLEQRFEELERRSRSLPTKPRTLLLYDWKAFYSANGNTFAGQLLRQAGAENLAEHHPSPWPRLSAEWILASRPDCILLTRPGHAADPAPEALAFWKKDPLWAKLPAVQNGRVFSIPDALLSIPGPRMADAAEAIWNRLHGPGAPPASPSEPSTP